MTKRKRGYKYDEAKSKSRQSFRRFIKNLNKDPRDIKVLFLPGEDAIEISEVFDPLGIPRANLTGLENQYSIYDKIRRGNYGIRIFHADDLEFLKQTKEKFDIIDLDYEGHFSEKSTDSLKEIASNQILSDPGILLTNFLGRREKFSQKQLYMTFMNQELIEKFYAELGDFLDRNIPYNTERIACELRKLLDDFLDNENVKLDKLREEIPEFVIDILMRGERNKRMPAFYKLNPDFNRINTEFRNDVNSWRNGIIKTLGPDVVKELDNVLEKMFPCIFVSTKYHDKINTLSDEELFIQFFGLRGKHSNSLRNKLEESKSFGSTFGLDLLDFNDVYSYFCKLHKSFKYISEGSSPMLLDFFYFTQERAILEEIEKYLKIDNSNNQFAIELNIDHFLETHFPDVKPGQFSSVESYIQSSMHRKANEIRRKFYNIAKTLLSFKKAERLFIGSSYKPKMTGKEFFRLKYVEDLTDDKIIKIGRLTPRQMRAFKAHAKRGTYGPIPLKEPAEEEVPETKIYEINDLFNSNHPYSFLERLPEQTGLRMKHFLDEDLQMKIKLTPEQKDQLMDNISHSKWYKIAEKEEANESQIYRFFDDIMLYCIWNERVPDRETIKKLLYNSLREEDVLPERLPKPKPYAHGIKEGGEDMSPRGRPYISKEAALALLAIGQDPKDIARIYRGFTPGQLRAFKAHITMDTYNQELTSDLAYELFGTCGLDTEDVRKAFPDESTKRIGAYKAWDTMRKR